MASVRGSSHAERSGAASSSSSCSTAGRNDRTATSNVDQRRRADDEEVHGQGYGEAGGEHADAGTADGAEAPGGVEPRHHGATETALDLGAFDVHGDVPDRRTEAVAAQAGGDDGLDLEPGDAEGDDAHAERHQHAAAATHARGPEPLDHPAARGQPEQRTDRDGQQQQAELAVGEVEPLAQVGHPREQGGEDQPVEDERGRHRVAGAQVRTGRLSVVTGAAPRWAGTPRARPGSPSAPPGSAPARGHPRWSCSG